MGRDRGMDLAQGMRQVQALVILGMIAPWSESAMVHRIACMTAVAWIAVEGAWMCLEMGCETGMRETESVMLGAMPEMWAGIRETHETCEMGAGMWAENAREMLVVFKTLARAPFEYSVFLVICPWTICDGKWSTSRASMAA
jgi:hypothetical protein